MINSRTLPLGDVLQLGRFEPARVQREFEWQTAQIDRLLNDLVAAFQRMGLDPGEAVESHQSADGEGDEYDVCGDDMEAEIGEDGAGPVSVRRMAEPSRQIPDAYFLGSIILFKATPTSRNHVVYDGLQRLTSLHIMLAKLRDTWASLPAADAEALASLLFAGEERRLTFATSGQSLASIVQARPLQRRDLTDGDYRMREAEAYFAEKLSTGWSDARKSAFLAFLQNRVHITVTDTENHSVAYQMFVGANTRGLRLNVGDVLKGLIADVVRSKGGTIGQVDTCARGWRAAQLSLRNGFNDLIHSLEVYKFRPEAPGLGEQLKPAPQHITGEKLHVFLDDTDTTAEGLCDWITGEFSQVVALFERARQHSKLDVISGINIIYRQLSFIGWTEWHPLYIALGITHADERRLFESRMRDLKRACYIIELLGWSEWTRRRKFMEAIIDLEDGKDPFRRGGALSFGRPALKSACRKLRSPLNSFEKRGAIVRWLETIHWGSRVPAACTDDASVEHVLPIAAAGDWSKLFGDDEREQLTNTIGNLCLLDKPTNEKVGNRSWSAKQPAYEQWRSRFKGVDQVMTASTTALKSDPSRPWTAETVRARTELLARKGEQNLALVPNEK